jgi:UDP-galactopyranose mutase
MINTDYLIVGCGLYGSVLAERIANVLKKKVIIIEKRNHIAGNCYSEIDKITGIEYHKYGTHIFHTNNAKAFDYITKFTKLNDYRHHHLTFYKNKVYQMPINLETINTFFKKNLRPNEAKKFIAKQIINQNYKFDNFEDKAISQIGKKLYEAFIKNYTKKHWGKDPKLLPASIFSRIPVRFNYDENYFKNCKFQGIPEDGYTNLFKKILANSKIKILLNKDYKLDQCSFNVKYQTIYTGPLDRLYNYKYGELEWRSLKFKSTIINCEDFQGNSVIAYPELQKKYTRIHEPRHLHPERKYQNKKTIIIKEYPIKNSNEPYYPIVSKRNKLLQEKYLLEVKKNKKLITGGRLADYAYYDMDMTILKALSTFNKLANNK